MTLKKRQISNKTTLEIIEECSGVHRGHFAFYDGRHSSVYYQKMSFLRYPHVVNELSFRLSQLITNEWKNIDVIIGPAMVGSILAFAVASHLNIPFTIVYKSKKNDEIKFHRDYAPQKGSNTVIVDDIAYSGNSLMEYMSYVHSKGINVLGTAVVCSRVPAEKSRKFHLKYLHESSTDLYTKELCPSCMKGIKIDKEDLRE